MAAIDYREGNPPLGALGGPAEAWPLDAGVDPLVLGGHRGKAILMVAEPMDATAGLDLGLFGPLGDMPYPDGGEWGWRGARVTLYPAATLGGSTRNDDVPAATYVPSRLLPPDNFGVDLFAGVSPGLGGNAGEGVLELVDPEGELDYLLGYVWDSAPNALRRGVPGTPFSTWETVARFAAANIRHDLDGKTITLRNLGWQLAGPLHSEYYGGTGGLDGDATLKGLWKPYAVGYVGNAEPVLIDAAASVYQLSFTPIDAVLALRHGGVAIAFDADYPTYEALVAAAIPSGRYGTCLAKGLVRLNVTIQYGVRLDAIGDSETSYGHPTPTTRAAIARRIATARGTNRLDDASQIDVNAFNRVEARHSAPVGWFWRDTVSKAEALTEVMSGILGWWRVRPSGELAIGWFEDPSRGSILSIAYGTEGMTPPRATDWSPPRAGTLIGWSRNYGPQQRSELAGAVDEATAAILAAPGRYAQCLYPHVLPLYPTAQVVTIEGGFWYEVDAATEAARQQGIFGIERTRWEWDMEIDPFVDLAGQVLTLAGVGRAGLGDARPLLIAGLDARQGGNVVFGGVG